jgi:DNA polymerase-4/DNA polymerase V
MSYETMAARIKADLERELGLTFSLGLAPTKVVAKIASKWQKPAGLTVISGKTLHRF